jgi:transposase
MIASGMTTREVGKKLRIHHATVSRILQSVPLPPGRSRWGEKATDERKEAFLLAYGETRNAAMACKRCGIAYGTHSLWLKKYPDFAAAFEKIRRPERGPIRLDHMEIARMAARGMSGSQIAKTLGKTSSVVCRILKRIQKQERIQAVDDMVQAGLAAKCTSSRIMPWSEARAVFGILGTPRGMG